MVCVCVCVVHVGVGGWVFMSVCIWRGVCRFFFTGGAEMVR